MARDRNSDGEFRKKRGDTHVRSVEEKYGVDFGVRSDMHLETLRRQLGVRSIDDLVDKARKKR